MPAPAGRHEGCSVSSIPAVSLSVARVPARSKRQKSSSSTTSASRVTGSPGEASVSPSAQGLLLRFLPSMRAPRSIGECDAQPTDSAAVPEDESGAAAFRRSNTLDPS